MATRFVVLTDCEMLRLGFEAMAANDQRLQLVGAATRSEEGLELVGRERPDVAVIDARLNEDDAFALCTRLSQQYPSVPVLFLSSDLSDETVRGAVDAGALGFVYKDLAPSEFASAIYRLARGEALLDARVTARVLTWASQRRAEANDDDLSHRELEVVKHVAQGESNKQIARRMGLTENTVKTYLRRAYRKLDCQTRSAATALLVRRGVI